MLDGTATTSAVVVVVITAPFKIEFNFPIGLIYLDRTDGRREPILNQNPPAPPSVPPLGDELFISLPLMIFSFSFSFFSVYRFDYITDLISPQ